MICHGGAQRTTEESPMASATLIAAMTAWVGGSTKTKTFSSIFYLKRIRIHTIMVKCNICLQFTMSFCENIHTYVVL